LQIRVAILVTCYNRVEKTLACLYAIDNAVLPDNVEYDIYLVDDNSPDETGRIVKASYSEINVIPGTGKLYWNRGMRLAWKSARRCYDYDFYLWINDDVCIEIEALKIIFSDYYYLLDNGIEAIVSGVCYGFNPNEITYGGRDENYHLVKPSGMVQPCKYLNGNFVLVSKKIFNKMGYLSIKYRHAGGDHDYGLKAIKAGFRCYITSFAIAYCIPNESDEIAHWQDPAYMLSKRIVSLFSAKGRFFDAVFLIFGDSGLFPALKYFINGLRLTLFPKLSLPIIKKRDFLFLYAGDIPNNRHYNKKLVGLSLTQNNKRHIKHDITNKHPFDDNSVDIYQAEDVFEHIDYDQLEWIIKDIYRILKPGGLFRLSVPDYRCDVLYNRFIRDEKGEILFAEGSGRYLQEKGERIDEGPVWFPIYEKIKLLLGKALFQKIEFLQYYDEKGWPVCKKIDYAKGFIQRTPDHDGRVCNPYRPMSIVVDSYKRSCHLPL
jgi:GT2 family glycosyltransferase